MSQLLLNGQTLQQYFQHGNGNVLLQRAAPQQITSTVSPQYIITRPVVAQTQATQQPQQHQIPQTIQYQEEVKNVQMVRKMMWLLVELESNNEGNVYVVVESKDVVGNLDDLHTGKVIVINYNNKQRRACIVMISDDKTFIFTELHTLNKLSEDNLRAKDQQNKKRRRVSDENARKVHEEDSSSSAWSSISQSNQEREIMPSSQAFSKKTTKSSTEIPPMTFDQQTQTDFKDSSGSGVNSAEISKLIAINQQILSEHNQLKVDSQNNRVFFASFSEEMATIRKALENISNKLSSIDKPAPSKVVEKVVEIPSMKGDGKVLNGNGGYFIIQTEDGGNRNVSTTSIQGPSNDSYMMSDEAAEFTIEEINADGSGRASNSSRFSYHDNSTMMSNSSVVSGDEKSFKRSQSLHSIGSNCSTPLQRKNQKKKNQSMLNQIQKDWNLDENVDDEKEVTIGSNKTQVRAQVLRSIDWENYKQATRKLLVSLFTRETLATHSLTGRPSPAFHDRNKPVKDRLDSNIIGDIIQVVTKYCGVSESQVRTAITTKCADENKMYRQRQLAEEKQFKQPAGDRQQPQQQQDNDKENVYKNS